MMTTPQTTPQIQKNKHTHNVVSLWIGDSSGTNTWSSTGRRSTSTDSVKLLISDQDGFQQVVLFGIGEEITRKQFACLLGGRLVPVE
jgi:hypothetical protein